MASSVGTRALLSATAAAVISTSAPSIASADKFHVYGCRMPDGKPAPADGWTPRTSAPGIISSCASGGAFGVQAGSASGESLAQMTYSAGPNLTAVSMTLWRTANASQTMSSLQSPETIAGFTLGGATPLFPEPDPYQTLESGYGDQRNGASPPIGKTLGTAIDPFNAANKVVINPMPTFKPEASLRLDARCLRWAGEPSCDGRYLVMASDAVLRDDTAPTIGTVAGGLVDATGKLDPNTPVTGTRSVIVLASDTGSGFYRTVVEVDGAEAATGAIPPLAEGANRCAPLNAPDGTRAFLVRQPCPLSGTATASLDTTKLADGAHEVRIFIEDASGNRALATQGKIAVRNSTTTGPGSPVEFRGEPNGSTTSDTAAIVTAGWTSTARPPAKSKSTQKKCKRPSYLKRNTIKCQGRAPQPNLVRSWSRTKSDEIVGRLVDPAGQPIAGATLELWTTPGLDARRSIGSTTTNANGEFRTTVQRAAGSQQVQVTWRARVGDTVTAAAADLKLKITVGSTFKTASLRAGTTVKFRGRIDGRELLSPNATAELQFKREAGDWSTFSTAVIDADGRWEIRRKLNQRATYAMRVLLRDSPRGLFAGETTKIKTVRIR